MGPSSFVNKVGKTKKVSGIIHGLPTSLGSKSIIFGSLGSSLGHSNYLFHLLFHLLKICKQLREKEQGEGK